MKTSIFLLEQAKKLHPIPYWARILGLHRATLHASEKRGSLSPSIAGALAVHLGHDPLPWIATAALESERDNACKSTVVSHLQKKYNIGEGLMTITYRQLFLDFMPLFANRTRDMLRLLGVPGVAVSRL